MEAADRVARFTTIGEWRTGELALVRVGVAIQASSEGQVVAGCRPRGDVTLRAGHRRVFPFERVGRGRVFLHAEERWLEAVHVVAGGTFALICTFAELAAVRVRGVAVRALREGNRPFEISARMTFQAVHLGVLPEQRISRLRVVEFVGGKNSPPARCCMAGFARWNKCAAMRIFVTIGAFAERNAGELRLLLRTAGHVALLAHHLRVEARQRKSRFRMVELLRSFPIHEVVTLQTILSEPAAVNILVTRDAILRKAEERSARILHFDQTALRFANPFGFVALSAFQSSVFALQHITRLTVIEALKRRLKTNQRETFAIMLGMAFCAVFLIGEAGVQSPGLCEPLRDLRVAFLALQNGGARANLVTTHALRGPAEELMGPGKRTGRDLGSNG